MKLKTDCRHFPGDRPCTYHKQGLAYCEDCRMYEPRGTGILIVKLEALGDVLRTTSVLPSLRRVYGNCHVTWVTSDAARDLFVGNPLVDELLLCPSGCLPTILTRKFDVVINPDASPRSCEIACLAKAGTRYGFTIDERGQVVPLGPAAEEWLLMGASDPVKQRNEKTYQQVLHEMCGVSPLGQHIVLQLTDEEAGRRDQLAASAGVDLDRPILGINTGAGERWRLKKWTVEGFVEVIGSLLEATDAGIVLLGGDAEGERNRLIRSHFPRRVTNPEGGNLREFIQLVNLCDVVLTGDTLALHVATGLGKRVVAYFGPTSHREIDLYGRGSKIVAGIDCLCCYRQDCSRQPSCMDLIRPEAVFEAVIRELAALTGDHAGEPSESRHSAYSLVGEPGR
jgi:heptosyltransferase-2